MGSGLRLLTLYYNYNSVKTKSFNKCLDGLKAIQIATLVSIFSTLPLFLVIFFGPIIHARDVHQPLQTLTHLLSCSISIVVYVYVSYLIFSFIKHLGFSNMDVVDGVLFKRYNMPPECRFVTTLIIGQNPTSESISFVKNNKFVLLERIVLNDVRDIEFIASAQDAVVSGMTLPSGVEVPSPSDVRAWRVVGNEIILK
jgi:hypothetical protein